MMRLLRATQTKRRVAFFFSKVFRSALSVILWHKINIDRVYLIDKVEKILEGSLDSIPSPSVKIQIMEGKVCLKCKGKTLLSKSVVKKLLKTKSLLTSPNNVLPYYLK